jgi:anti-sigma B factor antagonist
MGERCCARPDKSMLRPPRSSGACWLRWEKSPADRCARRLQNRDASSKLERHSSRTIRRVLTAPASVVVLRKEPVDIEVRSQSAVKVVKLRGRLNLGEAVDGMRKTFDDLMTAGDSQFVVDLAEVTMIDSSGIGLLVRCLTLAKQTGGSLKLLNPSKFAVQTLKMTGLLKLFEVFPDAEQAVASFR